MDNETMVNDELEVEDIDLPEEFVEDEETEEEEYVEEEPIEESEAPAEEQPESRGTNEPGYVQKRIERALARERDNIKAELKAEMEAQYAPIKERLLEMDAQELVRKGIVKDLETAKELVRYRNGQAQPAKVEQPRQSNGQFAPKEDPAVSARIDMLSHQADKIKASTGLDVIEVFSNNEEIKRKVIDGEMDFYDVAEGMKAPKKRPPSPSRSPNGASNVTPNAFATMSSEQFQRMERQIDRGVRYTMK